MPLPEPLRWQPDRSPPRPPWPVPGFATAMRRGLAARCPACGHSALFHGFLKVASACPRCGAPLGAYRSDDLPPYLTIFIVGHIIVPLMLVAEKTWSPPEWVVAAVFLPLTLLLTVLLMRPVKGATLGLMLCLGMERQADETQEGEPGRG